MANTPPSRSYKLFSGLVCVACAWALSAAANTVIGAVATASPATTLRLVIELETDCAAVTALARTTERGQADFDDRMGTSFVTAIRLRENLMPRSVRGSRNQLGRYNQH